MADKYRMFKNYMYNDLGITKEDIKHWTKEAIKEVALNHILHHMSDWDIKRKAERGVTDGVEKIIKEITQDIMVDSIAKDYVIKLEKKQ